jgi:hypothetical protein
MMFGWRANPHFGPFHLASLAFIGADLNRVECALSGAAPA